MLGQQFFSSLGGLEGDLFGIAGVGLGVVNGSRDFARKARRALSLSAFCERFLVTVSNAGKYSLSRDLILRSFSRMRVRSTGGPISRLSG